jgi:hypothetical protein
VIGKGEIHLGIFRELFDLSVESLVRKRNSRIDSSTCGRIGREQRTPPSGVVIMQTLAPPTSDQNVSMLSVPIDPAPFCALPVSPFAVTLVRSPPFPFGSPRVAVVEERPQGSA